MRTALAIALITAMSGLKISAQTKDKKLPQAKTTVISGAVITNGKKIYQQYCLTCHMADGSGVPNMNPPLVKTTHILGEKSRLIKVVLNGLDTGEEIDGETYTNVMPPHNFLKDQEIADVLTFVRNSFGNKASVITAAEVKALRTKK